MASTSDLYGAAALVCLDHRILRIDWKSARKARWVFEIGDDEFQALQIQWASNEIMLSAKRYADVVLLLKNQVMQGSEQ
jgi:hypothetical protein